MFSNKQLFIKTSFAIGFGPCFSSVNGFIKSSFSSTPTLPPPDSHPTGVGGAAGHHPGHGHCSHEAPQAGSIRSGRRRDRAEEISGDFESDEESPGPKNKDAD